MLAEDNNQLRLVDPASLDAHNVFLSTGIIYKLTCLNTLRCYYGSTSKSLNVRLSEHKCAYVKNTGISSRLIIGGNNFKIEQVEKVNYIDKSELRARERWFIEHDRNCINKNIPNRTCHDWHQLHPDYNKDYYEQHKDEHREYSKAYYIQNKDKFKQYYFMRKQK